MKHGGFAHEQIWISASKMRDDRDDPLVVTVCYAMAHKKGAMVQRFLEC